MLSDKKLMKIVKILGEDRVEQIAVLEENALRLHITNNAGAIKQAVEELEANPKYQEIKENLKALSEGMKEVKKHSNAVIQYALHLLEEKKAK